MNSGHAAPLTTVSTFTAMGEGRLIYVMGPSGAGKNSVIAGAREKPSKNNDLHFSHRYVTRVVGSGDDDFGLSRAAFESYCRQGMFALAWQAHGIGYGIGTIIDNLMRVGKTVVANGSRAYLETAQARYPSLLVVLITATAEVLRARLARVPPMALADEAAMIIDNSGPLEHATQALIEVLIRHAGGGDRGG